MKKLKLKCRHVRALQRTRNNSITIAAISPKIRTSNWILEANTGDDETGVWQTINEGDWVFFTGDDVTVLTDVQARRLFEITD